MENQNWNLASYVIRDAHFPVFQFPVGKREICPISRSGKTGKSGKIIETIIAKKAAIFGPYFSKTVVHIYIKQKV